MKARHLWVVTVGVAVVTAVALAVGLLALSRRQVQAQTPAPTPAVDLTGEWGFIYSRPWAPYIGGCIARLSQTDGSVTSTPSGEVECEAGGTTTGTGGVVSGTVSGLDVTGQVYFLAPGDPFTADITATVSSDGNAMQGDWKVGSQPWYPFQGSQLTTTCATPPCSDETVTLLDGAATVTFSTVTETGGTTVLPSETTTTGGTLPGTFQLAGTGWSEAPFYTVLTTAQFAGNIDLCVAYQDRDDDGFIDGKLPGVPETTLRLLHNATGSFDPATTNTIDTANNIICAVVPSLSEFALGAQAEPSVGGISVDPDLGALPLERADGSGLSAGVLAGVAAGVTAAALALGGAAWYARRRWLR